MLGGGVGIGVGVELDWMEMKVMLVYWKKEGFLVCRKFILRKQM